jgi:hypothetical protein
MMTTVDRKRLNAFRAELHAVICVVDTAVHIGGLRVVFYTDFELPTMALNRRTPDFSTGGAVDDLKIQLHSWFSDCKVQACGRSANNVAHQKLAKFGKLCNTQEAMSWDVGVPASIAEVAVGDLPQLSQ